MAKIAIILLDQHHEVLSSLITSLTSACQEVVVFTNDFCFKHLRQDESSAISNYYIRKEDQSMGDFLNQHKALLLLTNAQLIASIDGQYGEVVSSHFFNNPFLLVHGYHSLMSPFRHISFSGGLKGKAMTCLKLIKGVVTGFYKRRKIAASQYQRLLMPSESIMHHCKSLELALGRRQICGVAPFYTHVRMNQIHDRQFIKIIVPGTVIKKSRDYQLLIEALMRIDTNVIIEVVLLGKLVEALPQLEELKQKKNIKVRTYQHYLTQKEYDFQLFDADFLIIPLKNSMHFGVVQEDTGFTALSGNVNDITRFAIPALINEGIPMPAPIDDISKRFTDAESLANLINHWFLDRVYNKLKLARKEESWEGINARCQGEVIVKSMGL